MVEKDLGEPISVSIFDSFSPRVSPGLVDFVILAEKTGALSRLKPGRAELLVEYLTSDISVDELGGFLGITGTAVSQNIKRSLNALRKDMVQNHRGNFKDVLLAVAAFNQVLRIKQ